MFKTSFNFLCDPFHSTYNTPYKIVAFYMLYTCIPTYNYMNKFTCKHFCLFLSVFSGKLKRDDVPTHTMRYADRMFIRHIFLELYANVMFSVAQQPYIRNDKIKVKFYYKKNISPHILTKEIRKTTHYVCVCLRTREVGIYSEVTLYFYEQISYSIANTTAKISTLQKRKNTLTLVL